MASGSEAREHLLFLEMILIGFNRCNLRNALGGGRTSS